MGHIFRVPEPLQGDEGTLLVTFCIPNTSGWRGLVTAHLNQFTYGRNYDRNSGLITGAIAVGREIFASMSMCDPEQLTANVVASLDALTTAISNLDLSVVNQVQPAMVNVDNVISLSCSNAVCGVSEEDVPLPPGFSDGQNPPVGWEELEISIPVDEWRCRASNYVVDWALAVIDQFIIQDVPATVTFGLTYVVTGVLSAINILLASFGMGGILTQTQIISIALQLLDLDLDLPGLRTIIQNNRDDLVCAIYGGAGPEDRKAKADDVLALNGATLLQRSVWDVIIPTRTLLFFAYTLPNALGARVQLDVESHPMTTDCSMCACPASDFIAMGTEISDSGTQLVVASANPALSCSGWDPSQRARVYWDSQELPDDCAGIYCGPGVRVTGVSVTAGTVTQGSVPRLRIHTANQSPAVSQNALPWVGQLDNVFNVIVSGTNATTYEITIDYERI